MIRTVATVLLAVAITTVAAFAQPQISYVIPDIAAPGLNSYIEIIAPYNATGTFGTDGLYANDPSDAVRVELVNQSDTAYALLGPLVVSWNGRLVSTQFFAKPGAPTGITVPIRVVVNGTNSNSVSMSIVQPQPLGPITGTGQLGGGGNYGTRSARGAMIVDSLVIRPGNYAISVNTSAADGSGYFPLIVISKGPIRIGDGVTVRASGSGTTGGPGGGGGAAEFFDKFYLGSAPSYNNGGSGYTSGGPGGYNNPAGGGQVGGYGTATGSNGASLNGVSPGPTTAYEGGGGGTGHPFGKSGDGASVSGAPQGGYGGGASAGQNAGGGGAGYRTAGSNGSGSLTSQNGGRVYGNVEGVPLAGGSGGAAGNPQETLGGGAGAGGGGGGAIALYAMRELQAINSTTAASSTFLTTGANGTSGTSSGGGGGAGGFLIFGSKLFSSSYSPTSGDIRGGSGARNGGNGGNGGVRYEGMRGAALITGALTPYVGVSIDTLSYVESKQFNLVGSHDASRSVRIYMRSDATTWQLATTVAPGGLLWTQPITVPAPGQWYFVAAQDVPSPASGSYTDEPDWVLSQVAANIVTVKFIPKINTDPDKSGSVRFDNVLCDEIDIDTVKVWNTGDSTLRVTPTITGPDAGDFTILPPQSVGNEFSIPPGTDTVFLRIQFNPSSGGTKTARLELAHNDPREDKAGYWIDLSGHEYAIDGTISPSPLDLGNVCVGETSTPAQATLTVSSDTATTITAIDKVGPAPSGVFTVTSPAVGAPVAVNASLPISVTFVPQAAGAVTDSFRIHLGDCDSVTLVVTGTGIDIGVTVTPDPLDFGNVRVTSTASLNATIENTGASAGTITSITVSPAGAPYSVVPTNLGRTLQPGETVDEAVTFMPTVAGPAPPAQLCVTFSGPGGICEQTICVDLTGRGVTSLLKPSRQEITLTADPCDDMPPVLTDTFQVYNLGVASEDIAGVSTLGTTSNLTVTTSPSPLPQTVAPGDSVTFTVTWTPATPTTSLDSVIIATSSSDPAQSRLAVAVRTTWEHSRIDVLDASGAPMGPDSLVDFGTIYRFSSGTVCSGTTDASVIVENAGTLDENRVELRLVDGAAFSFDPPSPVAIAAGARQTVAISFDPTSTGSFRDTLLVINTTCPDTMRVALVGENLELVLTPDGEDFGQANVGQSLVGTASIVLEDNGLPGNTRVHVADAYISNDPAGVFAITNKPLPQDLAPGEGLDPQVEVTFTPQAEQQYTAQICFVIDQPCNETICVPLTGEGIQSNLQLNLSELNFGALFICQADTLEDLTLRNTGSADLTITSLSIDGADAAAFDVLDPTALPITLAPGQTQRVTVRFVPANGSHDGAMQARLVVVSSDRTAYVSLRGERRRQVLTTPLALAFGSVEIGTTATQTVLLQNRSDAPMTITALDIPAPFRVVDPSSLPITIPALGSVEITVEFSPGEETDYSENLTVTQTTPCDGVTEIPVTGTGKLTRTGQVSVVIPGDLTGAPGDHITIPLVLTDELQLAQTGATTFRATVRFRKTLLFPTGARGGAEPFAAKPASAAAVDAGQIVSNSIEGLDRVLTVEISNAQPPVAGDTLGFVDAVALLGDTVQTPVTIDTLYFTDGDAEVTVTTDDGAFTLIGYCEIGGSRLVAVTGQAGIKTVAPNPFNPNTEITFETIETGPSSLIIYDAAGREVERLVDGQRLEARPHLRVWNAGDRPSGIYYVVLTTPTQRFTRRLMLVK